MTLDPERVRKRGYFEPAAVSHLVDEMRGGEFIHLKQVLSLVILERWYRIYMDGEGTFGGRTKDRDGRCW